IAEQRKETAEIGWAVEEVWIAVAGRARARIPGLEERRVGRKREERKTDRDGEQTEQIEDLPLLRRPPPAFGQCERQEQHGQYQHPDMDERTGTRADIADEEVGIGIAGQEDGLEEDECDR